MSKCTDGTRVVLGKCDLRESCGLLHNGGQKGPSNKQRVSLSSILPWNRQLNFLQECNLDVQVHGLNAHVLNAVIGGEMRGLASERLEVITLA